jgi:hypothetical protein
VYLAGIVLPDGVDLRHVRSGAQAGMEAARPLPVIPSTAGHRPRELDLYYGATA